MELDLKNLLFTLSGFRPETELEKILGEQNLSLEEYLKNEEAIQCFKDMKKNAQKYFDRNKIKQLIKYITEEPKEDEYNIGYKYPYVACEMLKSAGARIQEMIIFSEDEFNQKYNVEMIDKKEDINLNKKTDEINTNSEDKKEENELINEKNKLGIEEKSEEEKEEEKIINNNNNKQNEIKMEIETKNEKKDKNLIIEIKDNNKEKEISEKSEEDSKIDTIKKEERKFNIDKHNELLDLLLDFVTQKNQGLNDVLCGYFSSVLISLINIYPADIFLYLLFVRKDALEQIVMHSYQKSLSIIASKLLKFDHYYFLIEDKIKINPGILDLELLKSKKDSFEDFRDILLEKVITSIDLFGMKDQNGSYLEGINIESVFLMLYDLLEDNAILISFKYNGKIKSHIFQMLNENIFNYNYVIEEKKKNMYNYFVIFLTKILHYLPEIEKTKDNFYPEFDYKNIFENIKKNESLSFEEYLIISIPKILTSNYQEISALKTGPLGIHNIYIINLVIELFNYIKNKPTIFDFIMLESGFIDKSISFFFKHQLNNIYHSKFLKFFDLYLQHAEDHPLLTDYFFNKKNFHLMLLDYITKEKDSEYLNKYLFNSGKTTLSCMHIYVIDLLYKIQAASGLKLLEENDKKALNILNYGYFEFIKDETSPKNIIKFNMPKYVINILSESKYWTDTMEDKIIPLIKKYETKLCFSQGLKAKELAKTNISEGVLNSLIMNLISLKNKNIVTKKEEPISNYNDINFWQINNTISDEIKNKVNSNINNNSNNNENDEEDELLNIAMNLEKEKENKKPKTKNIVIQPKINFIQKIPISKTSKSDDKNDNEIKTDSNDKKVEQNKNDKENKEDIKEENKS